VSPLCKGRMVRTVPKMERQSRCFNHAGFCNNICQKRL
jgi:hypothetical protein